MAVASILLGSIGLIRMRFRSTAPNQDLFIISVVLGILWLLLFGSALWYILIAFVYL